MTSLKSLALLTLAGCSLVALSQSLHHAPSPGFDALLDHQLAAVRGADREMAPEGPHTCEEEAIAFGEGVVGTPDYVGASECDGGNTGTTCVRCEEGASRPYGIDIGPMPYPTGEWISPATTSCGLLKKGTCMEVTGNPGVYDCQNMTTVRDPQGNDYECSDLFGYMEDQSTQH